MSDPVTEWSLCSLVFVSFMLIVEPVYSSSFRSIIPPSNWLGFLDSSHPIPEKKKMSFFLPFLARIMDDNFRGLEDDLELVTFFGASIVTAVKIVNGVANLKYSGNSSLPQFINSFSPSFYNSL